MNRTQKALVGIAVGAAALGVTYYAVTRPKRLEVQADLYGQKDGWMSIRFWWPRALFRTKHILTLRDESGRVVYEAPTQGLQLYVTLPVGRYTAEVTAYRG